MRIYLDNNATTPVHPEVLESLQGTMREVFGNASSIHKEGQAARRVLEEARDAVAGLIHSSAREVTFTSGGSESNNAAIFGVAQRVKRSHIVTTAIEHPSVLGPIEDLRSRGLAEVTVVKPDRRGVVDATEVLGAIRPDTVLVSAMLANNEVGTIQPVGAIGEFCRSRGIHLHCDAVQAAGKIEVDVTRLNVDTLSLSAHKLHAPKGIGLLYVRSGVTLDPHLIGGSQERRRRAGTENVPLAAAFAVAAQIVADLTPMRRIEALRDAMEKQLLQDLPNAAINGAGAQRLPNTTSLLLEGTDAEALVIALDLHDVAVSSGSACSSGRVEPSGTLLALGLSPDQARSSIRMSLGRFTTEIETEQAVSMLKELVPRNTAATAVR